MKSVSLTFISILLLVVGTKAQDNRPRAVRTNVPLDSIVLSDPFILADAVSRMYYMTGTGGLLWKSKDLAFWEGALSGGQNRFYFLDGAKADDMGCRDPSL